MRPCDPTAVAKRFAAVLARGIERADREMAESLARIRTLPTEDDAAERLPWSDEPSPSALELRFDDDLDVEPDQVTGEFVESSDISASKRRQLSRRAADGRRSKMSKRSLPTTIPATRW
jgi:hypothetical protein